jgi:hypothetical protein
MDFEKADFYRANFVVEKWWITATVLGGLPLCFSLIAAVALFGNSKGLSKVHEDESRWTYNMEWLS